MVTPLRGRDELDLPGLERLIEHILKGGVSGLFILGTTGEGPSLSYHRHRICRITGPGPTCGGSRGGRTGSRASLLFAGRPA